MDELQILLLEDSALDAELIQATLAEGGLRCRVERVQTGDDFRGSLVRRKFDMILADYALPSFDGARALQVAQEVSPEVPFLYVSGAMGEEVAIEMLKSGATDYVLKGRLERLVPSVRRALREAGDRAERRRLEEELRRRADELAEAARRKDEFLAMLAHELRNPLAPMRNAVQILRVRGVTDPTLQQARDIIDRQVHQLSQLVDDLLDVSRITRGKIQLRKVRVDLSLVARLALETAQPTLEKRQHRLTVVTAPEPLWVEGDPLRLEQVVTNLLTNAAKYTDPGGRVWLTTEKGGGASSGAEQAVLRVRDTGVGIAPEMQSRVFDLFMQLDPSIDRTLGGLGIGLTLVRRLVELHGGTIQVYSPGRGQGSEFTVRLPLAEAPAAAGDEGGETPAGPGRRSRARRVVVVDDNKDGAESLAMLLRLWGHDVRLAHDGPAALRAVADRWPEVVLLDIGLPGMDGYQVARHLRESRLHQVTLVALTGYGQDEDRRRSREAGFDMHLTKPVDLEALRGVLKDSE